MVGVVDVVGMVCVWIVVVRMREETNPHPPSSPPIVEKGSNVDSCFRRDDDVIDDYSGSPPTIYHDNGTYTLQA